MKLIYFLCILLVVPSLIFAGSSIFGFGPQGSSFYQYNYSTAALGRGGVETAVPDTIGINYHNFSLLSYNTRTLLSMNMMFESRSVKQPNSDYYTGNAKFTGGLLSFPVLKRKVGIGIGLFPVIGNDQQFSRPFQTSYASDEITGTELIKTSGTISEATFSIAINTQRNFAFALVGRYAFGMIKDNLSIIYDQSFLGDIYAQNKYQVSGFGMRCDLFYTLKSRLHAGLSINFPFSADLGVTQTTPGLTSGDTKNHSIRFPMYLSGGMTYELSKSWLTSFDINYANWKHHYKIDGHSIENMNDSYRLGAGIEKRPVDIKREKLTYRGGLFYGQVNMYSGFANIDEYGVGFGLGIPLLFEFNRLDIALHVGKRGKINHNLAEETFMRFEISISAGEFWFIRDER